MAVAHYTRFHMRNLEQFGHTEVMLNESLTESKARSRIRNAADQLGVRVVTRVTTNSVRGWVVHEPRRPRIPAKWE